MGLLVASAPMPIAQVTDPQNKHKVGQDFADLFRNSESQEQTDTKLVWGGRQEDLLLICLSWGRQRVHKEENIYIQSTTYKREIFKLETTLHKNSTTDN